MVCKEKVQKGIIGGIKCIFCHDSNPAQQTMIEKKQHNWNCIHKNRQTVKQLFHDTIQQWKSSIEQKSGSKIPATWKYIVDIIRKEPMYKQNIGKNRKGFFVHDKSRRKIQNVHKQYI